MNLVYRQF